MLASSSSLKTFPNLQRGANHLLEETGEQCQPNMTNTVKEWNRQLLGMEAPT
jgi:hypothetical protein